MMNVAAERIMTAAKDIFDGNPRVNLLPNPNVPTVFAISICDQAGKPLAIVQNTTAADVLSMSPTQVKALLRGASIPE